MIITSTYCPPKPITVYNDSEVTLNNVQVVVTIPEGLTIKSVNTQVGTYSNGVWYVGVLAPGIEVQASICVNVVDESKIPANIHYKATANELETNLTDNCGVIRIDEVTCTQVKACVQEDLDSLQSQIDNLQFVESVTGNVVDNTDPLNPVVTAATEGDIVTLQDQIEVINNGFIDGFQGDSVLCGTEDVCSLISAIIETNTNQQTQIDNLTANILDLQNQINICCTDTKVEVCMNCTQHENKFAIGYGNANGILTNDSITLSNVTVTINGVTEVITSISNNTPNPQYYEIDYASFFNLTAGDSILIEGTTDSGLIFSSYVIVSVSGFTHRGVTVTEDCAIAMGYVFGGPFSSNTESTISWGDGTNYSYTNINTPENVSNVYGTTGMYDYTASSDIDDTYVKGQINIICND